MFISLYSKHTKNVLSRNTPKKTMLFLSFVISYFLVLLQLSVLMIISCTCAFWILPSIINISPNISVVIASILFSLLVLLITLWRNPTDRFNYDELVYSLFHWAVFVLAIVCVLVLTSIVLYAPLAIYDKIVRGTVYLPNNQFNIELIWSNIATNLVGMSAWLIVICATIYGFVVATMIAFYKDWVE